jgi:hypothetical protein
VRDHRERDALWGKLRDANEEDTIVILFWGGHQSPVGERGDHAARLLDGVLRSVPSLYAGGRYGWLHFVGLSHAAMLCRPHG